MEALLDTMKKADALHGLQGTSIPEAADLNEAVTQAVVASIAVQKTLSDALVVVGMLKFYDTPEEPLAKAPYCLEVLDDWFVNTGQVLRQMATELSLFAAGLGRLRTTAVRLGEAQAATRLRLAAETALPPDSTQ
jgi:hypothetical protein